MANMTCPNCDHTIASTAISCPFCGYSLKPKPGSESHAYYHEDQNYHSEEKEYIFPDKAVPVQKSTQETYPQTSQPTASSKKRVSRQPRPGSPGRRLIGYRSGHFLNRWISMIYHLSAILLLIWAYQLTPEFSKQGLTLIHVARTTLGGIILFLPALLLSNTSLRRSLPLLKSRSTAKVVFGMLLILVPLVLLFSYSCILCR